MKDDYKLYTQQFDDFEEMNQFLKTQNIKTRPRWNKLK
jgi:hypothetical protein